MDTQIESKVLNRNYKMSYHVIQKIKFLNFKAFTEDNTTELVKILESLQFSENVNKLVIDTYS